MSDFPFYSFLPWARRGIASRIVEPDNFGGTPNALDAEERAQIKTYVHITTDGATTPSTTVDVNLSIIGPGDVIGIHQDVIVRTEPRNWITNFEPHSFPFIEFYEEDFPWRYTPAKPDALTNKKLRPWLTLVVLKENEFEREDIAGSPLSAFKIATGIAVPDWPLPKHDEVWAWAHVSINDPLEGDDVEQQMVNLNAKLNTNPDIAISRIICPRKLEENTSYHAFLIPTFETGRLAGLGVIIPPGTKAQAPAWDHIAILPPQSTPPRYGSFPIYHEWYFRTGATGDFEYLVRQVKPRVLDSRVGRRPMDIQDPGYGLAYTIGTLGTTAGTIQLEGALRNPNNPPTAFVEPYTGSNSLKNFINLGEDMLLVDPGNTNNPWKTLQIPTGGPNLASDPVITPPLYGRWHALLSQLGSTNTDWPNELNLDPRNRMAASLGGDYVRKNQEFLMDEAWDQVGKVLEGNKKARLAQLALETSKAMSKKHLASQPLEQLLAMTGTVHAKIKTSGGVSVLQDVLNSQLPESADSNAFRKIRRPTGVQMKRVNPNTQTHFNDTLVKMSQSPTYSPGAGKTTPNATTFDTVDMNNAMVNVFNFGSPASLPFNISSPSGPSVPPNSTVAINFQDVMNSYNNVYDANNWNPSASLPDVMAPAQFETDVKEGIAPGKTITKFFKDSVKSNTLYDPPQPDIIVPAMTAPSFFISMYKSLQEQGLDYFIPNLNLIPQNSITLLETNSKFIESFLIGANYEMGRELLWREYPTDQRGTYFRHFWENKDSIKPEGMDDDVFELSVRDITDMDTWYDNELLGSHSGRTATTNNLVLAIRGDFLKKFPTAVVYAQKAKWQQTNNVNDYSKNRVKDDSEDPLYPIYSASVDPDITFLAFDLTREMAIGLPPLTNPLTPPPNPRLPGYYFVILERPGELRFGLDIIPTAPLTNWSDLSWSDVTLSTRNYLELDILNPPLTPPDTLNPSNNVKLPSDYLSALPAFTAVPEDTEWAEDSAAMAMILYQNPVMVMIHAHEMLA